MHTTEIESDDYGMGERYWWTCSCGASGDEHTDEETASREATQHEDLA